MFAIQYNNKHFPLDPFQLVCALENKICIHSVQRLEKFSFSVHEGLKQNLSEFNQQATSPLCCPYSSKLNTALLIRHPVGLTGEAALQRIGETHNRQQEP